MSVDGACIEAGQSWNCGIFGVFDNTPLGLLIKLTKTVNINESLVIKADRQAVQPVQCLFVASWNDVSE